MHASGFVPAVIFRDGELGDDRLVVFVVGERHPDTRRRLTNEAAIGTSSGRVENSGIHAGHRSSASLSAAAPQRRQVSKVLVVELRGRRPVQGLTDEGRLDSPIHHRPRVA